MNSRSVGSSARRQARRHSGCRRSCCCARAKFRKWRFSTSQALFVIAPLALLTIGLFKTWSYGIVLLMHGVTTLASWKQYLDAFDNLLFFAAWPMFAACIALFLLRKHDTLLNVDAMRTVERP